MPDPHQAKADVHRADEPRIVAMGGEQGALVAFVEAARRWRSAERPERLVRPSERVAVSTEGLLRIAVGGKRIEIPLGGSPEPVWSWHGPCPDLHPPGSA